MPHSRPFYIACDYTVSRTLFNSLCTEYLIYIRLRVQSTPTKVHKLSRVASSTFFISIVSIEE